MHSWWTGSLLHLLLLYCLAGEQETNFCIISGMSQVTRELQSCMLQVVRIIRNQPPAELDRNRRKMRRHVKCMLL